MVRSGHRVQMPLRDSGTIGLFRVVLRSPDRSTGSTVGLLKSTEYTCGRRFRRGRETGARTLTFTSITCAEHSSLNHPSPFNFLTTPRPFSQNA